MTTHAPTTSVTCSDGVRLAVHEWGPSGAPVVVAVHGYPDDHTVWDGVAAELADRYRVVAYDVRGAGASDRPAGVEAYRMSRLVDDLATVLDAVSPEAPVHLLAHDWGSIQAWDAVTDPRFADRLLSFTSISGPSLDQAGVWLRRSHRHPLASARQLFESVYLGVFQLPLLPELLASRGVVGAVVALSSRHRAPGDARGHRTSRADARDGINLYRANIGRLLRPAPRSTSVPVQVLAPVHDLHVSWRLQSDAPRPYVDDLQVRGIDGNHWVVSQQPDVVARLVDQLVRGAAPVAHARTEHARA